MATFDRFDICYAYQALENDWNKGGWLRERPSNQRRRESIGCQLARLQFRPGATGGSFQALLDDDDLDNARHIYVQALVAFHLAPRVDPDDDLGAYIRQTYVASWVAEHFPQLLPV